jgi:hypothetical protein
MGLRQYFIPMGLDLCGSAVEDLIGSQQIQGAMPVAGVVPRYEPRTKSPGFIQRSKAFRIRNPALEGREQAFDKGVVVADMRTASSDPNLELPKHVHQVCLFHGTSVIGVDGQKGRVRDPMPNGIGQDIPRQKAILPDFHGPGHKLAAEQIHEGIEITEPSPDAQAHRGDVPTPDAVDGFGFQLPTATPFHHQRRTRFHRNKSIADPVEACGEQTYLPTSKCSA